MAEARSEGTKDGSKKRELLRVDQYYSKKASQVRYKATEKNDKQRDALVKYVVVVRRLLNSKGYPEGTKVDIRSSKLVDLLCDLLKGFEDLKLSDQSVLELNPQTFYHAHLGLEDRQVQEKRKDPPDRDLLVGIETALLYLEQDWGPTYVQVSNLLSKGLINYDLLWTLFTPNMEIYTDRNSFSEPEILKFKSGRFRELQSGEQFFEISASVINHDGELFGWGWKTVQIPVFSGTREVSSLDVLPLHLLPKHESVRRDLTERGRTYTDIIVKGHLCKFYGSVAVYAKQSKPYQWEELKFWATRRVVIDPAAFFLLNNSSNALRWPEVLRSGALNPAEVEEENLAFCNYRILGFNFDRKQWGSFAVSSLKKPNWNDAAFDKVTLPEKRVALIKDLVRSHRSDGSQSDNIIEGKGQGLIGLLSGKPGVGKTLTAEAIAEVSHRPLYMVSAGELGTEPEKVDEKLEEVLEITRKWNCVLLIDEAEVFLHKRDQISLVRNALVSIFLRRLEYFAGVAILTTNRKADIDDAFMSRIHFKFHYESLQVDERVAIWKNRLGQFAEDHEEEVAALAKDYVLNGREIQNAVSCANSISKARGDSGEPEPLSMALIKEVLDNLSDFGTPSTRVTYLLFGRS